MKPERLRLTRWMLGIAAFMLFVLAASPASAQRGRTGGERQQETEETRRTPETRETRREPEAKPAPEPQSAPQTRERGRTGEAAPAPAPRQREAEPARSPQPRQTPQAQPAPPQPERGRTSTGRTETPARGRDQAAPARSSDRGRSDGAARESTRRPEAESNRSPERGRSATSEGRQAGDRQGRIVSSNGRSGTRVDRAPQTRRDTRDRYRWVHVPPVPKGGYHYRPAYPVLHLEYEWPWQYRYQRSWSPRYRYRQVVYIESGYGREQWTSRLDVRTTYRQRVRSASRNRAQLDLDIEAVEIYQDGQYLGRVTRIPDRFGRVRATVHRNGRLTFDRDVSVVGSREAGFEIIATRSYGGYFLSHWQRGDRMDVGFLDLRRNRVERVDYSRLLDYDGYRGYAPVSILPEDERWLGDYGPYAVSTFAYDDDFYDDYRYDDGYYYGYGGGVTPQRQQAPRGQSSAAAMSPMLQGNSDDTYRTPGGAQIRVRREAEIQRIE